MKTIKSMLVSAGRFKFADSQTGALTTMTKITYLAERSDTDDYVGHVVMTCTKVGDHVFKLKDCIGKTVDIQIDERQRVDGVKYVIKSVGNVKL